MINGMNKTFESEDDGLRQSVKALNRRMDAVESILDKAKEVLTLEEAARFLGMAKSTLYKLTHEQAIPYYKPNGKCAFFERSELLKWIRTNRVSSRQEIDERAACLAESVTTSKPHGNG